jgi:hypothetical protein
MNPNLKAKAISRVTFLFADGEVINLFGDETARDTVEKLKKKMDEFGGPMRTYTGVLMKVVAE